MGINTAAAKPGIAARQPRIQSPLSLNAREEYYQQQHSAIVNIKDHTAQQLKRIGDGPSRTDHRTEAPPQKK
jgi:hypothetical protein